jgi:hypothetical protein
MANDTSPASPAPAAVATQAVATSAVDKPVLRVSSDKRVYAHGDVMKVTIEIPMDRYLRLYGVSAGGSTALLFPNKWSKDDKVAKGILTLPAADALYDFMLALDAGQTQVTESVHAVFSLEPFVDSGNTRVRGSRASSRRTAPRAGHRQQRV